MLNLIALAIPFFLLFIAVEVVVARAKKRPVYRLADAVADMGCGVTQQVTVLFYVGALTAAYGWLYEHARVATLPGWAAWSLAFLGVDFLYYWWHRLSHEVNLLWAAHVVHHQSEDYNLAVALRQSVTTSLTLFPFYAVLAFAGVPPLHFAVANSLSTLYQFWIHSELVPQLGPVDLVINTPSLHRVHHAINPGYLDKNHGATLMLWDRLFGTFALETEEPVYGITRPLGSFNPLWAQLAGWVDLVSLARRAPSPGQALQVFVRSPAWHPEWMGPKLPALTRRSEQTKYDVQVSGWVRWYAFAWFCVLLAGTFSFLMWNQSLDRAQTAVAAGLIFATVLSLSGLLEGRWWVKLLEPLRLLAVATAVVAFVVQAPPAR